MGNPGRDPAMGRILDPMAEIDMNTPGANGVAESIQTPVPRAFAPSLGAELDGAADEVPHTVLALEDALEGRLSMSGNGTIRGRFQGHVDCAGELEIGPRADVNADVRALNITISGRVRGQVLASGRLRITATGRLEGDATVGALVVDEGGVHRGQIRVHPEGVPEEPEPVAADSAPAAPPAEQAPRPAPLATSVERVKKFWGEFF